MEGGPATPGGPDAMLGRRDRGKAEHQRRIKAAAAELFRAYGFNAVTTQQIAERADVGAGTVFNYASTKGELLVMVYNDVFAESIDLEPALLEQGSVLDRLIELYRRLTEACAREPENLRAYMRETLFANDEGRHLAEAYALVQRLRELTSGVLSRARDRGEIAADVDLVLASRNLYALFYMTLTQAMLSLDEEDPALERLRAAFSLQLRGLRPQTPV